MVMKAQGSVLVQGAAAAAPLPPQWVRVVRAFMLGGKRQEPGTEIPVPRAVADELVANGKAARIAAPAPAEPPAPVAATAPTPTPTPPARKRAAQE